MDNNKDCVAQKGSVSGEKAGPGSKRDSEPNSLDPEKPRPSRRSFLAGAAGLMGMMAVGSCSWEEFFQQQYQRMSKEELARVVDRLKAEYKQKYGMDFVVGTEAPLDATMFAYALDVQRCIGCRKCVYACVDENNQTRSPETHYIKVLRFKDGDMDFEHSQLYYNPEEVPEPGHYYMPVQCQQCAHPPCTKVCPVRATWPEKDGIVVVDYNWCIGCRYCMSACPYEGRRFNWGEPALPKDKVNPNTHYLGNRPRMRNVVEKCTFCIQRVRLGKYPACVEACPVGARKFGNILDPNSEINLIIQTKRVFRLKSELNTEPRFYYFFAT